MIQQCGVGPGSTAAVVQGDNATGPCTGRVGAGRA